MFWADKFADEIIKSGKHKPYHVDDMKTPSGRVHVGALRGMVVHGLIHQALLEKGEKSVYTFVINDMDPMDGFPHYLPKQFKKYMGQPLYKIPSPEKGFKSMARCYGEEFVRVSKALGIKPEIIWSSEWYKKGKFDKEIRQILDRVKKVRELYHDVSGYDKPENWYPYQVICPKCGKVGTTIVIDWNGEKVSFECRKDLVKWAEGCGYEGKIEPVADNGKLMWKMDWATHWKVIEVTIEGSGKDHMTEGGSHDLSSALCEQVLEYPTPFSYLYEWFLARGGLKMSSSKGVGVSAAEIAATLPPEILKFLMVRTPYRKAIIFDPSNNDSILDLFDAYDKATEIFFKEGVKNPEGRAWQLSQVDKERKDIFLPRFRDVVNYVQSPSIDIFEKFSEIKGGKLTVDDKKELEKRIKYAKIWLENYASDEKKIGIMADKVTVELSDEQKKYLKLVVKLLGQNWQPEKLQQKLFDTAKENEINPKEAFQSIYLSLTGNKHGPKAGWFLLDQDKKMVIDRFNEIVDYVAKAEEKEKEYRFKIINKPDFIKINPDLSNAYPTMQVAMAMFSGVNNQNTEAFLQYKNQVMGEVSGITLDDINNSRKIKSYRKAIKESGIDWHKRRPTMEALLRRVATGKEIAWINPLVDVGNLMAMKHQASQGVFDLDQVKAPIEMRLSDGGEKVLMIGDKEEITLDKGEICYFDKKGPFIVDLCWRDAQRTGATEKTNKVLFLSEAVHDVTRSDTEEVLDDLIKVVTKYLGGQLETAGIITK